MVRKAFEDIIAEEYGGIFPGLEHTQNKIMNIMHDKTRIFCILAYLTGGRISEVCLYKTPKLLKKITTLKNGKVKESFVPNPNYTPKPIHGIRPKDLRIESDFGKKFLIIHMRNLKNGEVHYKTVTAPIDHEGIIIKELMRYIQNIPEDKTIIPYERTWVFRMFKKYAVKKFYYPHFLRALRTTHLFVIYDFDSKQVKDFMGWSDERPIKKYEIFKTTIGFKRKMLIEKTPKYVKE